MRFALLALSIASPMLMLNADKGGSGGGEKKTDLELLDEAKAENAQLKGDLENMRKELAAETQEVARLEGENAQLVKDRDAAIKAKEDAEKAKADADTAEKKAKEEKDAAEKAARTEKELRETADDRAETRLREISARNGGTLPPKDAKAGDHTTEQKPGEGLKGIEKARALLAAKMTK